jgi:acetylglutamate kinase
MNDPELADAFASDIIAMKQMGLKVVIVHGGGAKINNMLERFHITGPFVDGVRVTDQPTIEMIEMIMSGLINKQIVSNINKMGGSAIGISGKDANLIEAKRIRKTRKDPKSNIEKIIDLGFMGEVSVINPEILLALEDTDIIPVISPIAIGEQGETFRVSSDEAAASISSALTASKLIIMDDYPGIVHNGAIINAITLTNLEKILKEIVIDHNFYCKINIGINALKFQTEAVHFIDGRVSHSLLLEIFTEERLGTMIYM